MEYIEKQTILKNISWLTFSRIIVYVLSIITITIVPRYLGVEGYGQLNFVLSFFGLFYILTDFGINTLIFRDVSKNTKKLSSYFNNFFIFKLLLVVFVSFIIILLVMLLEKPLVVNQLFFLLIPFLLISVLKDYYLTFYNSLQDNKFYAISELIFKVCYILFLLIVIFFDLKVTGVLISQILASLIILGMLYIFFKKHIKKYDFKLNYVFLKQKLYLSWPFALNYLFYTVYFNFDKIFISLIKDDVNVGLYSIGYSFLGFIVAAVGLISLVFFPVLSKYSFKKNLSNIFSKYYKIVLIVSIPLSLGSILLSKEIISLVFGSDYVLGNISFKIIMFFCLLYSINNTFNTLFSTHHYEKYFLKLLFLASVTNVLLNLIVIPFYGIVGAAITTLFSEIIILVGSIILVRNKFKGLDLLTPVVKPLFAGLIMLTGIFIIKLMYPAGFLKNNFDVLFFVFFGGIIYLLCLFILKIISKEDIKEIISLIKK